jgi:hypothetical protein
LEIEVSTPAGDGLLARLLAARSSGTHFVNWCGHGQEFVPWPEKDGYWLLVPVVEVVAK